MISLKELHLHAHAGEAESLAKFGFNSTEKISSLQNFSRQMESHALHVIEDRPVSNAHSYFIDKGEIYIDEERKTKLSVDPEERDGLSLYGTQEVIKNSLLHPGQVIFLYSPPGKVAFENGTKYDKVKPYPDGQLYLLVGKSDDQVDAMAISVSKEQERQVLSTFFGKKNMNFDSFDDEVQKIKYFLTTPTVTDFDIDGLLTYLKDISYLNDFPVYKNVHDEEFLLSDVLYDLRRGWMKEIRPKIKINYLREFEMIKNGGVGKAYLNQLQNYFPVYSKNGKMPLGGGCGGNDSENEFDTSKDFMKTDPLSTNYRLKTPSIKDIMKKNNEDSDEKGSLEFDCPVCGGEHTRKPHELIINCPSKRDENGKEIPIPKC
ncbi:MAG: hypothetical protein AAB441_05185 [Patescibacteria group bacterium]